MPNQFSNQAANADVMGEDAQSNASPEGMTHAVGADGTPRDRSERASQGQNKGGEAKAEEAKTVEPKQSDAKPGKDINAPGFVKDKDASKP
jgi:hypothetical protein